MGSDGKHLPGGRQPGNYQEILGIVAGVAEARRILSSTVGSESLVKFFTLLESSTAYKNSDSYRYDPFCRILNMELLQFYYSGRATGDSLTWPRFRLEFSMSVNRLFTATINSHSG
jgi:hypothetical protein